MAHCNDDRLFVLQQNGQIRIVNMDGAVENTPFLNISNLVLNSGERGLLGMAFHPNYSENGYFFVNYSAAGDGNTVIARYQVSESDPNVADPNSHELVISIEQPYSNHNGGCIRFSTDGNLLIGMGDGGSGGDPDNYSQNPNSLLGKMLRINVDNLPYTIPASNPILEEVGAITEIYATGLRNPWKFSVDHIDEMLWIADVGQNAWEEINATDLNAPGLNYGWRCYEGNVPYNLTGCEQDANYVAPVHVYDNTVINCSVTGGYVYRGSSNPGWYGRYFFTDFCSNSIFVYDSATEEVDVNTGFSGGFATFGEDKNGELYVAGRNNGRIFKLISPTANVDNLSQISLEVYPNPSTGIFEIKGNVDVLHAKVYDLQGRLVQELDKPKQIDLENAPNGIYWVNFQSTSGVTVLKLLKQ